MQTASPSARVPVLLDQHAPPGESWDLVEVSPLVDPRDLWYNFRKRLPWLIAIPALFVTLALVYLYVLATPLYKSTALVFIDPKFDRILQIEDVHTASSDLDSLNSLEKAITSESMILRVIDRLGLKEDRGFLPKPLQKRLDKGQEISDSRLIKEIAGKRIKSGLIRPTRLIEIVVLDPDPTRAKEIAETIVSEFEIFLGEQKRTEAGISETDLRKQAEKAFERALEAEKQLEAFRKEHPEFTVEQDHQLFAERLSRVGDELNSAAGDVLSLESRVRALENIDPETDPVRVIEISKYSDLDQVANLLAQRATAKANLASISTRYTEIHPRYMEAVAQYESIHEQLLQMARDFKVAVSSSLEVARFNEESLSARVRDLQAELTEVKSLSSKFRAVQQKVETEWLVHQNLQTQIGQTALSTEKSTAITTMMSKPLVSHKASKPNKPITVLASGFFGIFLGLGLLASDLLRGGPFATRRQAEQLLQTDVVAEIPAFSESAQNERTVFAEMTRVLLSPEHRQSRLIHVTAVSDRPDGLRTAAALASASAHYSCDTLLISILPVKSSTSIVSFIPQPSQTERLFTMVLTSEILLTPNDAWQLLAPSCQPFGRVIIETTETPQNSRVPSIVSSFSESNLLIVSMKEDDRRDVTEVKESLTRHSQRPFSLILQG